MERNGDDNIEWSGDDNMERNGDDNIEWSSDDNMERNGDEMVMTIWSEWNEMVVKMMIRGEMVIKKIVGNKMW
jgi:subtilase family serine protease